VRVAEEWAVVDNISQGRVGVSFAAGWQPNDFVLNPTAYAGAGDALPGMIDTVRRLWRGETVDLPGHDGAPIPIRTLPRPVQAELPVWLTSAGSPETFERAGRLGLNILTHLLGQSVGQLRANIARYRAAWRDAGHAGGGQVTLMLHTYLHEDASAARERARGPLTGYLSTAVGLVKNMASAFPTFAKAGADADEAFRSLTEQETAQLLDLAADRYLSTSGLFGGVEEAVAMIGDVAAAGVDEVACLIDFGIDTETVLGSFDLLGEVHRRVSAAVADAPDLSLDHETVAALVERHGVTHLQCTPSLAAMLIADPDDRKALGKIRHLMLGGEALPTNLAAELRQVLPGRFTNMYGPTETTIWSLTHEVEQQPGGAVPIGGPIANTAVFVLDACGRRLPVGAFGELHIGGEGVARGYHARPELTGARFVDRPGLGRLYATGDLVRAHPDGHFEFAGRTDNQVKIRGHRIELGEIEAALDRRPEVARSVVVARGAAEPFLVAFVVAHKDKAASPDELRDHLRAALPEAMVPSRVVLLDALPLTPNGKIDRKQLPAEAAPSQAAQSAALLPPANDAEAMVAGVWEAELQRPVGRNDNFFDIGGHSLLAVKIFRRLSEASGAQISLTDVFRFPTVKAFAARLDALGATAPAPGPGSQRGAMRRMAMTRRPGGEAP
jgi:natural product biosynthesis luciferase-like monooxygenase protein